MRSRLALLLAPVACSGWLLCGEAAARDESPPETESPRPETESPRPKAESPRARPSRRARAQPTADGSLQVQSFDQAWKRVGETYHDPTMKGLDWEAVRAELRPRAQAARNAREVRPVIQEMLGKLGESHFQVIPQEAYADLEAANERAKRRRDERTADREAGFAGAHGDLGLDVRVVDGQVVVTRVDSGGPADMAGVRTGWVLESVDGDAMEGLLAAARKAHPDDRQSTVAARLAIGAHLAGRPGQVSRLDLLHGGDRRATVDVERRRSPGEATTLGHLPEMIADLQSEVLPGNVGYIRFNIFLVPVAERFTRSVGEFVQRGASGVVVDVRGNPGGLGGMIMGMCGHFMREGGRSLGSMKLRQADLSFAVNPRTEMFDGPLAVLVDGHSISTAELFAAGLKETGRARVFGTTTAGMALPSVIEKLPNGDRLQFAFADCFGPTGERIEGRGVVPDVEVELTRASLLQGRDDVLEAALAWIAEAGSAVPPKAPAGGSPAAGLESSPTPLAATRPKDDP